MNYFLSISGIPGSGKSTLADFLLKKISAVHISSDMIRKEYFGDSSLVDLRYKKPLKSAVIKILDLVSENNLLKKNNIIYDSVQSDPNIFLGQEKLCNTYKYQYITIELLFSYSTLKKRIVKRTNDPFASEADLSVLTRFWKEKISSYGLDDTMDEFEIVDHIQREFLKKKESGKQSILLYETKDLLPKISTIGNPPDIIQESLAEFVLSYFA